MKRIILHFVVLLVLLMLGGCTLKNTYADKTTAGKAYDVVVVCNDDVWHGDLSYAVCDLLEESAPGFTRPQGYFNIVKQVAPAQASDIDRKYPNLLIISINPTVESPTYSLSKNIYARPQTIITLTAPSVASAIEFIESATPVIRGEFEKAERNNSNNFYAKNPAEQLMTDFKEHIGVEMLIPANFYKATTRDENLLWYIRDFPKRADYIFAFNTSVDTSLPYDLQALSVMAAIDQKLATISSKGASGSYMRLSGEPSSMTFTPDIDINGKKWLEIRCWWEVANDFMGGPMVSYVTVEETTGVATIIMFAIYAPEDPQRNLLRDMEHLIYTTSQDF